MDPDSPTNTIRGTSMPQKQDLSGSSVYRFVWLFTRIDDLGSAKSIIPRIFYLVCIFVDLGMSTKSGSSGSLQKCKHTNDHACRK